MAVDFALAEIEWGTPPQTLTLLELVKQLMGISDGTQDDELSMYIQMAGEACEKYIDNKLASQPVKEYIAKAYDPVPLRYWPVTEVTGITVDGVDVTTDWDVFTEDGISWSVKTVCGSSRNCCFEQMEVAYTAGYDPLPSEVGYVIARTSIAYEAQLGGASGSVKKEVITGVGSVEYTTDEAQSGSVGMLSPAVTSTLDLYRRYHV